MRPSEDDELAKMDVTDALQHLLQGDGGPCDTNTGASLWCCTEDGRRPLEVGLQEQASNRPVLLRPKDVVVSDRGKVILQDGRYV